MCICSSTYTEFQLVAANAYKCSTKRCKGRGGQNGGREDVLDGESKVQGPGRGSDGRGGLH